MDLIDFLVAQPESKGITNEEVEEIKDLFFLFKTDEKSELSYLDQFVEYLYSEIFKAYGATYQEIMIDNIMIDNNMIEVRNVAISLSIHSEDFWTEHYSWDEENKERGSGVFAADIAGGLWGLLFGPAGSIIAGGVSSMVADLQKNNSNSAIFDAKFHTPKYI